MITPGGALSSSPSRTASSRSCAACSSVSLGTVHLPVLQDGPHPLVDQHLERVKQLGMELAVSRASVVQQGGQRSPISPGGQEQRHC
jgi:hypothetical protein